MSQCYFQFVNEGNNFFNDNFCISECNKYPYNIIIEKWPNWAFDGILLSGESKSGKSHLSRIWASKTNATIVNYNNIFNFVKNAFFLNKNHPVLIDSISEMHEMQEELFHLYNVINANKIKSIWVIDSSYFDKIYIKDFKSRLMMLDLLKIDNPDNNEFISNLFKKQLHDNGIVLQNKILEFLVKRTSRSFYDIYDISSKINHLVSIYSHNLSINDIVSFLNYGRTINNGS